MIWHIVFYPIPKTFILVLICIGNLYFEYMAYVLFRVTFFDTENMPLSELLSYIKMAYIVYTHRCLFHKTLLGNLFSKTCLFAKVKTSHFITFSFFIFKYRPIYLTDSILNAN